MINRKKGKSTKFPGAYIRSVGNMSNATTSQNPNTGLISNDNKTMDPSSQAIQRSELYRHSTLPFFTKGKMKNVEKAVEASENLLTKARIRNDKSKEDVARFQISRIREIIAPMKEKKIYRSELIRNAKRTISELKTSDFHILPKEQRVTQFFQNIFSKFQLWSSSLKIIEGQFGTGIVSYFIFLRWLLLLNIITFLATFFFVVVPQIYFDYSNSSNDGSGKELNTLLFNDSFARNALQSSLLNDQSPARRKRNSSNNFSLPQSIDRKSITELGSLMDTYVSGAFLDSSIRYTKKNYSMEEIQALARKCNKEYLEFVKNGTTKNVKEWIQGIFQGTGWMTHTILFIGYYSSYESAFGLDIYNMAVANILVLISVFLISVMLMLLNTSKSIEESLLGHNLQETYSYNVLCGWDYSIADENAAFHRRNFIHHELVSTLLEERKKSQKKSWTYLYRIKVYGTRGAIHLLTVLLLVLSYYAMFSAASFQTRMQRNQELSGFKSLAIDFLPPLTVTGLNVLIPILLQNLVQYEHYNIRNQINITLLRIILLREIAIILLLSSFYNQINCEPKDICHLGLLSCNAPICWETYVGQQMYRLVLLDFIVNLGTVLILETLRSYVVRKCTNKFTKMVGKPNFDIPLEVLNLIYSQTLCWLGLFYCPFLPLLTIIKLFILFYIKKFTLFKNCKMRHEVYRASKSNSIFVFVLLLTFLISLSVVGYSLTEITPSPGCSPYRIYPHMTDAINLSVTNISSKLNEVLVILFSPLFAIPLIILLCLLIYFYLTKATAHMKMVQLLKVQLSLEGKDKQYLLARVLKMKPRKISKFE